jgi:hypothetical protein
MNIRNLDIFSLIWPNGMTLILKIIGQYEVKHIMTQSNKKVDIKFSAHDTFLKSPSSGTLKVEILENQIILNSWEP